MGNIDLKLPEAAVGNAEELTKADKFMGKVALCFFVYWVLDSGFITEKRVSGLLQFCISLVVPLLLVIIGLIAPLALSVRVAKQKGYSACWAFVGIWPFAGWFVLLALSLIPARIQCMNCGGFVGSHFRLCPYCHLSVHGN